MTVGSGGAPPLTRLLSAIQEIMADAISRANLPPPLAARFHAQVNAALAAADDPGHLPLLATVGLDPAALEAEAVFLVWALRGKWPIKKLLDAVDVVLDSLTRVIPQLHVVVELKHLVELALGGGAAGGNPGSGAPPGS